MVSISLPLETETNNSYELVGRWLATIAAIERNLDIVIEFYLIRSISGKDEVKRTFWRHTVAAKVGLDRKIQIVTAVVEDFDQPKGEFSQLPKMLQQVRELRNNLAHRFLTHSIDGTASWSDAYGHKQRKIAQKEFIAQRQLTIDTYNLSAGLANRLGTHFDTP